MAQAAIPVLVQHGGGSLFFTGASASLRGKANFAPFASAKAAVRNLAIGLLRLAGDFGISYVTVFNQHADDAATVMAALAAT